jgi:hypothetical protein
VRPRRQVVDDEGLAARVGSVLDNDQPMGQGVRHRGIYNDLRSGLTGERHNAGRPTPPVFDAQVVVVFRGFSKFLAENCRPRALERPSSETVIIAARSRCAFIEPIFCAPLPRPWS